MKYRKQLFEEIIIKDPYLKNGYKRKIHINLKKKMKMTTT